MIIASLIGLIAGVVIGLILNISYPSAYSFYVTMGLLAAMDSVLGAIRSSMEGKYDNTVFISGFAANAVLAGLLVYLGDRLGIPLYYAVILTFGGRLFQNLAAIRHLIIERVRASRAARMELPQKRSQGLPVEEEKIFEKNE